MKFSDQYILGRAVSQAIVEKRRQAGDERPYFPKGTKSPMKFAPLVGMRIPEDMAYRAKKRVPKKPDGFNGTAGLRLVNAGAEAPLQSLTAGGHAK